MAPAASILSGLTQWARRYTGSPPLPRIFPETAPRNCIRWIARRPGARISSLPNFGLICGAVILTVVFVFMIYPDHAPYVGLPVPLERAPALIAADNPWHGTLSVYVAASAKGDRFYINGREARREELGAKLQEQLNRRAEWTVYFEADGDTLNMDAIYVIDTVQGLGAKVAWITPQVRKEWNLARTGGGHPSP